ncbi:MAG: hypothetical protein OHK0019_31760 [Saprospiraceae bacterium]
MGTYYEIELLKPDAAALLEDLAKKKLIRLKKVGEKKQSFLEFVKQLRAESHPAPSEEEISAEVEAVRAEMFRKSNG